MTKETVDEFVDIVKIYDRELRSDTIPTPSVHMDNSALVKVQKEQQEFLNKMRDLEYQKFVTDRAAEKIVYSQEVRQLKHSVQKLTRSAAASKLQVELETFMRELDQGNIKDVLDVSDLPK